MRRRQVLLMLAMLFCGILLVLPAWPSFFHCRHDDIDIRTGRIRRQWILFGLPIGERIEESPLSRHVRITGDAPKPEWRRSVTSAPFGSISPHYTFHAAVNQTHEIDKIWQLTPFSEEAKRHASETVLTLWRQDRSDAMAEDYLRALGDLAISRGENAPALGKVDLPKWP